VAYRAPGPQTGLGRGSRKKICLKAIRRGKIKRGREEETEGMIAEG